MEEKTLCTHVNSLQIYILLVHIILPLTGPSLVFDIKGSKFHLEEKSVKILYVGTFRGKIRSCSIMYLVVF